MGISILTTLLLGIVTLGIVYWVYEDRIEKEYVGKGQGIARAIANLLEGETIDRYLSSLEKDENYENMLRHLKALQKGAGVEFISIAKIVEGGAVLVFDTHEVSHAGLGEFYPWSENYGAVADKLILGESVDPVKIDTEWGRVLAAYEPIYRVDGTVAAYVGVYISMEEKIGRAHV